MSNPTTPEMCDHAWTFQGVYAKYGNQCPGSSAYSVVEFDRYFCGRCLDTCDKNERVVGNSYIPRMAGVHWAETRR